MKSALPALLIVVLAYTAGYVPWIQPLIAARDRLVAERELAQTEKLWVGDLRDRIEASEARHKARAPAMSEIANYFLRSESERLRMAKARDEALAGLDNVQVSPLDAGPGERISFDSESDPNLELAKLKSQFLTRYPRVALEKWDMPAGTEFLRVEDRLKVDTSYQPLFAFLAKIQAGPLFLEVTSLDLECDASADPASDRLSATVGISSLVIPQNPEVDP